MTEIENSTVDSFNKSKDDSKIKNDEVESKPSHHARRPMNAFLIFCKKHRTVVKKNYPNYENRAVTRILGDWWANLDDSVKNRYVNLSNLNKKAFYEANPNFKWYKLPAPPLKSLASRLTNNNKTNTHHEDFYEICDIKLKHNNNHLTKLNYNIQPLTSKPHLNNDKSIFTPGKLADITQMGSLNTLMNSNSQNSTEDEVHKSDNVSYPISEIVTTQNLDGEDMSLHRPLEKYYETNGFVKHEQNVTNMNYELSEESKLYRLQNELSETSRHFEMFDKCSSTKYVDDYSTDSALVTNFEKIKNESSETPNIKTYSKASKRKNCIDDESKNGKLSYRRNRRSCKGMKYLQFMHSQGIINNKRFKQEYHEGKKQEFPDSPYDFPDSSNQSESEYSKPYMSDDETFDHISFGYDFDKSSKSASKERSDIDDVHSNDSFDKIENTPFVIPDFDLDAKINELPSLSFDDFLRKKKENKQKKNVKQKEPKIKFIKNKYSNNVKNHVYNPKSLITAKKEPIDLNYLDRDDRLKLTKKSQQSMVRNKEKKSENCSISETNFDTPNIISNERLLIKAAINNCTKIVKPTSDAMITYIVNNLNMNMNPLYTDMSALYTLAEVATADMNAIG